VPAALLMANLQATLRGQCMLESPVADTIARSNQQLYRTTDPEKFATLFLGVLDPESGRVAFCNAGHERPMLFRTGGTLERLIEGGLALGVLESWPYNEGAAVLAPGDFLVLYSDGIPEATDELGNFFGEDRLIACIRQHATEDAAQLMGAIIDAVRSHEQGTARADDLTIVVIRRLPA